MTTCLSVAGQSSALCCRLANGRRESTLFGAGYAALYDFITAKLAYKTWVDYLEDASRLVGREIRCVLDLGCGTGSFALEALSCGLKVIAVDSSSSMLERFRGKLSAHSRRQRCRIIRGSLVSFQLPRKVDAAVCFFDTLNYLAKAGELQEAISHWSNFVSDGGILIFDLNRESAYRDNRFQQEGSLRESPEGRLNYTWRGSYCRKHRLHGLDMIFSTVSGVTVCREYHLQRFHSDDEVEQALRGAGFSTVRRFRAFSLEEPGGLEDRITYVAVKARSQDGCEEMS